MALNVGENFKQRWLNTPEAVRHTICDELSHICTLLDPDTSLNTWHQHEALQQHKHHKIVKHAYEQLKQQILAEQARLAAELKQQQQARLEAKIAQQRALEQDRIQRLEYDEQQQRLQELQQLKSIAQQLEDELNTPSASDTTHFNNRFSKQFNQTSLNLEEIQTRLELESEVFIEQQLNQMRLQLKQAAQDEIERLLQIYRVKLDNHPYTS